MPWSPDQYERFKEERSRPFYDLLALLEPPPVRRTARVVDLGCGTGDLTAVLHRELGAKETIGVDSSISMLEKTPTSEVIEWVKGTLLTQYRARLDDATYTRFLSRYRERLFEVLPDTKPYLYPFKRLLLWGRLAK